MKIYKRDLIICALKAEARPIINFFDLSQNKGYSSLVYTNTDIVLLICGIGSQNSYLQTKFILDKFNNINRVFNIGICGAKDTTIPIGSLYAIDKLYYKNSIFNFATIWPSFSQITTLDIPLEEKQKHLLKTPLVDMELGGIVKACLEFDIPYYNIHSFKIVSDHLNTKIPKAKFVNELIRQNIDDIKKLFIS